MNGFQQSSVLARTNDGQHFTIEENIDYIAKDGTCFRAPVGVVTDGASTPPELWPVIPPFGLYWRAAVLHDASYDNTLLIQKDSVYVIAALTKEQCDALLLEAMESLGVNQELSAAIYEGVHVFGQMFFNKDRGLTMLARS